MINIAQGKNYPFLKKNIRPKGWSIEARLCSEDPIKNFLPSAEKIKKMIFTENIRIDSGYKEGNIVSIYYDSLLAKIISKGKNRSEAIYNYNKKLRGNKYYWYSNKSRFSNKYFTNKRI